MGNNFIRGTDTTQISLKHPQIAHAQLLTSSNRQILRLSMPSDETAYKKWKDALLKFPHLTHEHLLLPLNHKFATKGLCASTGTVEIDFPNNHVLLSQEIANRQDKNLTFTEGQLWYLLYALLSAKSHLKDSCKEYPYELIGDVRPQNVFINPEGQVRFANLLSWPGEKVNYLKTFDGIVTYLSPEDYEGLQLGKMNNESNKNSSESFSIGFTLLSSALLIDNSSLYDIQNQRFDGYEAQRRINAFKVDKSYSELLRAVVSGLSGLGVSERLSWSEVWNWVRKYEKNISQRKDFSVDQIPASINQQLNLLRSDISTIRPEDIKLNAKTIERKQMPTLFSTQQTKLETREVPKSSSGYYSPRNLVSNNGQQTKVFIQYKSPGKDASSPIKQVANIKKEETGQTKKDQPKENQQEKKPLKTKNENPEQLKKSQPNQSSLNIQNKSSPSDQKSSGFDLQLSDKHIVKSSPKNVSQDAEIHDGNKAEQKKVAQKVEASTKKQQSTLKDIEKLQQIKKESDKAIVEISSQAQEEKTIIEEKTITLKTKQVFAVLESSQQAQLQSSAELAGMNIVKTVNSVSGELNESTRRSVSGRKRDFLDDVMQTNKVLNREEDKDYAFENKFLNVEESQEKK